MNGNWFWRSRVAIWIEDKLLKLTNWFWKKRHQPDLVKKPATRQKQPAVKKPAVKKTTKKSNWNVKG